MFAMFWEKQMQFVLPSTVDPFDIGRSNRHESRSRVNPIERFDTHGGRDRRS
jgi:hypothetical protein